MAREFPIHNGRMTTDLDANGHKIKNLPPGSGFTQVQSDWGQTDTTAPDFIKNKPTIPAPVTIDPALSQTSENPVQNKVVSKALYTGFTEWEFTWDGEHGAWEPRGSAVFYDGTWTQTIVNGTQLDIAQVTAGADATSLELQFKSTGLSATMVRHLVTPTKTSQLTNDGPSSGPNVGHPFATTNQIPAPVDISGKLDGAAAYEAWASGTPYPAGAVVSHNGRLWFCLEPNTPDEPSVESSDWEMRTIYSLKQDALSSAQLAAVNSGATAAKVATWDGYAAQIAQKANTADLPYALVEPGAWEFSGLLSGDTVDSFEYLNGNWEIVTSNGDEGFVAGSQNDLRVEILIQQTYVITATRPSLPGHLCDRAGNRVVVTGDTTLTLPAAVPGYIRDFLVRLEISGSTVPTITFQGQGSEAPNGADEITYETDGDEFPVPDEAGSWLYSFTEDCVAHKFAVSLKKVNEVAAPQTQGGS